MNDVVSTLSVQNKAKVILITDACRAGKLSGSGIGGAQATAANLAKQYANELKILSCQPRRIQHRRRTMGWRTRCLQLSSVGWLDRYGRQQ